MWATRATSYIMSTPIICRCTCWIIKIRYMSIIRFVLNVIRESSKWFANTHPDKLTAWKQKLADKKAESEETSPKSKAKRAKSRKNSRKGEVHGTVHVANLNTTVIITVTQFLNHRHTLVILFPSPAWWLSLVMYFHCNWQSLCPYLLLSYARSLMITSLYEHEMIHWCILMTPPVSRAR